MYRHLKKLATYEIIGTDGLIGKVSDFYFDEHLWTVRYIVVNTGGWLLKNLVLLSPISIDEIDDEKREIKTRLSNEQIEQSPDFDAAKPVSRQKEIDISNYYRNGLYWIGYNTWGMVPVPTGLRDTTDPYPDEKINPGETHLRSMKEVIGYHVQTETGELGHVTDMTISRENWSIDFFVLNTHNILPGDDISFNIRWIKDISWDTQKVYVKLSKESLIRKDG